MQNLRQLIRRLDRNAYKLYKNLEGEHSLGNFTLRFDRVQNDPFAPPSKATLSIGVDPAGFPRRLFDTPAGSVAFRDALSRSLHRSIRKFSRGAHGTGNGGLIAVESGGQVVFDRNSVTIRDGEIAVKLLLGLPSNGRTIDAAHFETMLFEELPAIVDDSLNYARSDPKYYAGFVNLYEKQEAIRAALPGMKLVAFVADRSVLPRKSGVDDTPLSGAVPFRSPESLRVEIELPGGGKIAGMGVPEGVTLVTGGAYHGKSTLVEAIQNGVWNHVPGDGREYVVTRRDAVKVRSEDGRRVAGVNISLFVNGLPQGKPTDFFETENASGSTSQAASVCEALEAGSRLVLMDEDTSAANFLIRDRRIRELIPDSKEPVTPYADAAGELYRKLGVSTVIAVGGSGEYFDCADTVIAMDNFAAKDVTAQAKGIARAFPSDRPRKLPKVFLPGGRVPDPDSVDASKGKRETLIAFAPGGVAFGRETVDLAACEQVLERAQYAALGFAMLRAKTAGLMDGTNTVGDILAGLDELVRAGGLDALLEGSGTDWEYLCEVRPVDVAAALGRLRSLRVLRK